MTAPADTISTIIPCFRYRDAKAAIDWLCRAFGFERHAVHEDDDGGIRHAQLSFGRGMVMLGSVRDDEYGKRLAHPDQNESRGTQSACVVVQDARAHYERAKAAGARITMEYAEQDYGGAGYGCTDLEGYSWWFGSYDPWQAPATE